LRSEPPSSSGVLVARNLGPMLISGLPAILGRPLHFQPWGRPPADTAAIVGWGYKGVALRAKAAADRYGLPYLALEDGFLRSVALGDLEPPRSVVLDDIGIYYDARRPSRLERLIAASHGPDETARGHDIARLWCEHRLSKYNHAPAYTGRSKEPLVLVVDQTAGDASIAYGLANERSFHRMLEAALDEHPSLPIVLKVHPDVIAGRKRAHFMSLTSGQSKRVTLLAADAHPPDLLASSEAVYTVTSQMGFEALIWGKPVRCFGMPFYAGWGLTNDDLPAPPRRRTAHAVSLEDLVHAALVEYPRYLDPETGMGCEVERMMVWMALQRRLRERPASELRASHFAGSKTATSQPGWLRTLCWLKRSRDRWRRRR
jgi:capsular polysaccharide export protein